MLRRLIACWVVLAMLCGFSASNTDPMGLNEIASMMNFDKTNTSWKWATVDEDPCQHGPNAGYLKGQVRMCDSLRIFPAGVVRFVFAHELAHGVIEQRDIPYTGSYETAADELATVMLIASGHVADVEAAANWLIEQGNNDNPFDPHGSDLRRGFQLLCYVKQHSGLTSDACFVDLRHTTKAWVRLLEMQ